MSDDAILRFAQGIKAREEASATAANENFYATRDITPDQAGEANILARETTLPQDVVQRNLPAVREGALAMLNRQYVSGNPKLATWASNPAHASLAKDDIARLDKVSRSSDYMTSVVAPKATVWNYIKGVAQSAYQGAGPELKYGLQSAATDLQYATVGNREMSRDPQSGQFHWVSAPTPAKSDAQIQYERARASADDATPDFKSWWARSLYGGVSNLAQMAPGIAASVLTANPAPALAMGSAQASAQGYGDIRAAGGSPLAAGIAAPAIGVIEAATEFLPTKVLTKGLGRLNAPKALAEFLGKELLGEEVATVTQNAVQTAATPGDTWAGYLAQLPADMRDTAIAVGVAGLALHGAGRIAHRVAGNAEALQGSADGQQSINAVDALMSEAAKAKTLQRDPEAFRQFIAQHTDGTHAENLYVPAEKLRELYQSERFNPDDESHRFLADFHTQVDQAAAIGGDVVIPMADAVANLAGKTGWDLIRGDARVSPGGMSENEAKSFEKDYASHIEAQSKDLEEFDRREQEARAPEQQVHDEVFSQLRQAGYAPDAANAYAALWSARYATRAAATGTDAYTAFKRSNATIQADIPEAVQAYRKSDHLDLLINAMRGKDRAGVNRGPSLLEWISKRGGIEDRGGDIASMGGNDWHKEKAFRRRLIKEHDETGSFLPGEKNANTPDSLALDAQEAGYFPSHTERPTANDLLDAIGEELRGTPRHSDQVGTDAEREANDHLRTSAESLRAFLSNAGLDPDTASRAEIDAALKADEGERSYEQSAVETPAFKRWFGDSKVVDAQGRPLVVYHGSDNQIEAFQPGVEREKNGNHGIYFTKSTRLAGNYAGMNGSGEKHASPTIYPVFLKIENPLVIPRDGPRKSFWDKIHASLSKEVAAKQRTEARKVRRSSGWISDEDLARYQAQGYDGIVNEDMGEIVVFSPTQIKSAIGNEGTFDPADPRVLKQSARGRIDLFTDGRKVIRLFEQRDLSTLLHESGHLWLEELREDAEGPGASDQLKADWKAVQDYFKANGHRVANGEIPTEAHELFARSFERYAMEGKAPSTGLRAAFSRFRSWLLRIYQVFDNLNAPISPEIREVFNRMLATRDEIDLAAQEQHLQALFTDAAQAGMTEEEFNAYRSATMEARNEAFDALLYRTMETIRRQRTKDWKAEERGVRDETTAKINARPEFRALHLLRTGTWLGEPERDGLKVKLDRQWLVDNYGTEALNLLPKGVPPIYGDKNTTNAEDIAEVTGFRTGDELVRALMGIEAAQKDMREAGDKRTLRNRLIDEETTAEMRERHGDPLNDGSIEEEALAAVHNERQGEIIASEARALSRRANGAPTPLRIARVWAKGKIGSGKVADVASRSAIQRYARAAAKAAKAAEAAMLKGDIDETFRQKQSQLLNHALLTEAKIAADEVDSAVKRMASIARRRTIASVDQDFLDRAHGLLEKFNFAPATQKALNEQASFAEWQAAQRANGVDVLTPPRLEANGEHYSRISVDELRSLRDSVEQIVQLGRLKQKLIDGKEQRDFDEVVAEAVDGAGRLKQKPPSDLMEPGWKERFTHGVASVDAALLKMEQVFDWLDSGNAEGVFNRVVFRPIAEAQDRENDMMAEYLGHVRKAISTVAKETLKRWSDKVVVPELLNRETGRPWTLTRQSLVSMALNMGNAGNIQRLTDGYGWNEDQVRAVLNRELTADEWKFVQTIWDTLDGLWPHISEMERRINGFAPEKVASVPVETPHGTFAGGYFPAVYDTTKSLDAEANAAKSGDLFETTYTRATTRASSANERVEKVKRPILLNLGVINRHLGETIHDITHREAVMNADKFLSSKRVMAAVDQALGPEIRGQFRPWLKFVANRWAMERAGNEGLGKFINKARANATIVGMGYRLSTILTQIAGYSNSAEYVGAKHLTMAIAASGKSPIDTYRFVIERSGEVRHRMDTLDRDIGQAIRQMAGMSGVYSDAKRFAFHGIGYMDRVVAVPTWIAGYNKALEAGKSEEDAIYEGDKAVRLSQGAGSAKDLAAVQRGTGQWGQALKLFTMFYSYLSAFYQRERTLGRDVMGRDNQPRNLPKLAARAFFLLALPSVLSEILAGRGPDDDEDWAYWAFKQMTINALSPIPLLRDVINPLWNSLDGSKSFGVSISPLQRSLESGVNVAKDIHAKATGGETKHATKDVLEAAGYATGLVPGQVASASQFLVDLGEGDQEAHTVGDWYRGLTTGKSEKH